MSLRASMASFCRIPATRSRSEDVARTAAAAGLFSSWVSPADSAPRASSRSRWPTTASLLRRPRNMPSSRWAAIGNHAVNCSPSSAAGRDKNSRSVTACTDAE